MTELTDKELAIEVAEKLGDVVSYNLFTTIDTNYVKEVIPKYLQDTAARVLFAEGTADKIGANFYGKWIKHGMSKRSAACKEQDWWRTITPRKVLEAYIELGG